MDESFIRRYILKNFQGFDTLRYTGPPIVLTKEKGFHELVSYSMRKLKPTIRGIKLENQYMGSFNFYKRKSWIKINQIKNFSSRFYYSKSDSQIRRILYSSLNEINLSLIWPT